MLMPLSPNEFTHNDATRLDLKVIKAAPKHQAGRPLSRVRAYLAFAILGLMPIAFLAWICFLIFLLYKAAHYLKYI